MSTDEQKERQERYKQVAVNRLKQAIDQAAQQGSFGTVGIVVHLQRGRIEGVTKEDKTHIKI
jgi:isoaspartyl peptidase/L-asparaginase-like protein (Ntn-hydrolase superfamily)